MRTTRQPGLRKRQELRARLIHDFDPMKKWIEDHPDCRGNAMYYQPRPIPVKRRLTSTRSTTVTVPLGLPQTRCDPSGLNWGFPVHGAPPRSGKNLIRGSWRS